MRSNAYVLSSSIALAIAAGCTGDPQQEDPPPTVRDAGPRDGGETRDAGPAVVCGDGICDRANGEDVISCPGDCFIDRCPDRTEGCECSSTFADGDQEFLRDDCEAGLLCVPWDTLSQRNDLTGPLQSCVKPCAVDADCGDNRACVDSFGFADATGASRVCVDRVAEQDEYCGTTKLTTTRVADVMIRTPEEQVGCGPNAECAFGIINGLHIDEGVCLQFCGLANQPACGAENPYCNPKLLTRTATDGTQLDVGVCSKAKLGVGSWCLPDAPNSPSLTQFCDTSDEAVGEIGCIGLGLPYRLCMEVCDTTANPPANDCDTVDADQGALVCVNGLLNNGGGLCMSPDCNEFPDTCRGAGAEGNGRLCLDGFGDNNDGLCVDRRSDILAPATIDSAGNLTGNGDDCRSDQMGFTQCPDNTICVGAQGGGGACAVGCSQADAMYCEGALTALGQGAANATCAAVFADTTIGVCGGD